MLQRLCVGVWKTTTTEDRVSQMQRAEGTLQNQGFSHMTQCKVVDLRPMLFASSYSLPVYLSRNQMGSISTRISNLTRGRGDITKPRARRPLRHSATHASTGIPLFRDSRRKGGQAGAKHSAFCTICRAQPQAAHAAPVSPRSTLSTPLLDHMCQQSLRSFPDLLEGVRN